MSLTSKSAMLSPSMSSIYSGEKSWREKSKSPKPMITTSLFDSDDHMLSQPINSLSMKIQKELATTSASTTKGNFVILKLEPESIDYLERINLNVMEAVLVEASSRRPLLSRGGGGGNEAAMKSPESECSLAMTSIINPDIGKTSLFPLSDLESLVVRIKDVLPRTYAEEACTKAQKMCEMCAKMFSQSKKVKLLKAFLALPIPSFAQSVSHHTSKLNQQFFAELMQIFVFPLERIHNILCDLYKTKIDIYISIYLVSILEHITQDMLHLSTNYVSYMKKYSIAKRDVHTAIHADHNLVKIANLDQASANDNDEYDDESDDKSENDEEEEEDDEDEVAGLNTTIGADENFDCNDLDFVGTGLNGVIGVADTLSLNSFSLMNTNFTRKHLVQSSNGSGGGGTSSNEDGVSDSSTICAETASIEHLNNKYMQKVKEFSLEQNQHLADLNILRHIFMYLFQKYLPQPQPELIDKIFSNINDVYECALRLADLIDDSASLELARADDHHSHSGATSVGGNNTTDDAQSTTTTTAATSPATVGQHFWEICEGAEFDVYLKYAFCVTDYKAVVTSISTILNTEGVAEKLEKTSAGLTLISRYLLPKLLLGSLYHLLYIYETIEALSALSTDDDDKVCLSSSLDTLKTIKYNLNKIGFTDSKKRPIETSFRIFQPHQLQSATAANKQSETKSSSLQLSSTKSLATLSQKSAYSISSALSQKSIALAYNINQLTEKKWSDLELNVDSLKLPSSAKLTATSSSTIRYAYLYEGSLKIADKFESKASKKQPEEQKKSLRYTYLFDGLLILLKKQVTSKHALGQPMSGKIFKFKQSISLDKYFLNDVDDGSFSFSSSSGSSGDRERIAFYCNPDEKTKWMSMLCYSKYKLTIERLLQTLTEEQNKNNPIPRPPSSYMFDQPDSPQNILFEQFSDQPMRRTGSNNFAATAPSDLDVDQESQDSSLDALSIKAASLVKLVERLTHHLYLHPKLSSTFLMFFREFCTPRELLSLLAKRYDVPDLTPERIAELNYNFTSGSITERELLKRYKREYQEPIRLKVINFMKRWIEGYFEEDFASDASLVESLREFIDHMAKTNKRFGQLPLKSLQRKMNAMALKEAATNAVVKQQQPQQQNMQKLTDEDDFDNLKIVFKSTYSSSSSSSASSSRSSSVSDENQLSPAATSAHMTDPKSPWSVEEGRLNFDFFPPFETHLENQFAYDILTIHPLEFARQATLMEQEIFKEIKPNELTSLGWKKPKQKYKLSPNVSKLINLTNKFTYWYVKCIVDTRNLEERVAVVHRLLDIAGYFYQMNNFNGMREIYGAFGTSTIHRLHVTKEKSGLEQSKIYSRFKQLFDDHESGYMERLKKCSPPCLPFIGKHLELVFKKHECNKLNSENHRKQIWNEQRVKMEKLKGSTTPTTPTEELEEEAAAAGNPSLVNFSKYRLLIDFVSNLLQYQNVSYRFRINERIRSFILDDIENYIEEAKRSSSKAYDDAAALGMSPPSIQDTIEAWLHEKSKQIEPFDVYKYPKIRTYPLKSPPPSFDSASIPLESIMKGSANNKNLAHLKSESRSQSTTRLDKPKSKASSSAAASSSKKLSDEASIISESASSSSSHHTHHKRSSSSTQNQQKQPPASSKPSSASAAANSANKSSFTALNSTSASSIGTFSTSSSSSSSSSSASSQVTFPSVHVTGGATGGTNIVPFKLASQPTAISSGAVSPHNHHHNHHHRSQLDDSQMSLNSTSSSILYSIVNAAAVGGTGGRGSNGQKLSLSSADSSSSAPNSPPPNYDEVFDSSATSLLFASAHLNQLYPDAATSHSQTNISPQPKPLNLASNMASTASCSSIASNSYPNHNPANNKASSVFAFPDLASGEGERGASSASRSAKPAHNHHHQSSGPPAAAPPPPPPPTYIPPLPPSHAPPVIRRDNKPAINKAPPPPPPPSLPPPPPPPHIPPRPK